MKNFILQFIKWSWKPENKINFGVVFAVFCISLLTQVSAKAEENFICDTGKIFRFSANKEGGFSGSLGQKFTLSDGKEVSGWCHFEGITLSEQYKEKKYGDIYKSTLENLIFFSGFHDHCSSGTVLVFNIKHQTVVEMSTWGVPNPKTHKCKLN